MEKEKIVKFTPELVESLESGQVFVFGSNLLGCHAGGASLTAMNNFGAVWGQAEGMQGQCYAIPVDIRGEAVDNVSSHMKRHIDKFIAYAKVHQEQFFLVPRIGCGAAGFDDEFMAPFFKKALDMENVSLPMSFVKILDRRDATQDSKAEQKVFNLIILDESGSMASIAKQAVSGLNETFQTIGNAQKEHKEQKHFISFVTFNSVRIRTVMDRMPVDSSKQMEWTDYQPNDCTPLYDAMGQSIKKLRNYVGKDDVVLVTIITDGYENASREYNGRDIKELVSSLKKKGWVFAYIGTNQDVDAVADEIGIRSRMAFEYSAEGAACMFREERSSKQAFFNRLSRRGRSACCSADYDYFSPSREDAPEPEEELEKEPDIVWDVKDEEGQDDSKSEDTIETPERPKGLWSKVKDYITG